MYDLVFAVLPVLRYFFDRKLHFRKYFEKKLNFSFLICKENEIVSSLQKMIRVRQTVLKLSRFEV